MPNQMCFQGEWSRRRFKSPNRPLATLFGTITLWRMLYQPLDGVERASVPLEIRLGLEAGLATPALAERAAQAATASTQDTVLASLKRDPGVCWSVASLRTVIAGVAEGMEPHRQDAQVAHVLKWLEEAFQSRGGRKPVLVVGRDGLMLPIRDQECYREGATATISVHDRRGRRLGTVYLGRMPEPGQETLSRQLTALLEAVLRQWTGPLPRLAYITDGGYQQTRYFRRVLKRMHHPRHPGQRLEWEWVIDYYHACEYVYKGCNRACAIDYATFLDLFFPVPPESPLREESSLASMLDTPQTRPRSDRSRAGPRSFDLLPVSRSSPTVSAVA